MIDMQAIAERYIASWNWWLDRCHCEKRSD
ncbi:MAG: hypothetical protein QOH05_3236, partial [Acetobacteraceae bacterium]|nr:hypothetical protein [Acetobacteraceae bacterium]